MNAISLPTAKENEIQTPGLDNLVWQRAWLLSERLLQLRTGSGTNHLAVDRKLGQEMLALWRSNSPFDQDSYFAQRLAMDRLTEDELLLLLGASPEELGRNCPAPEWAETLARLYSTPQNSNTSITTRQQEAASSEAGFLNLLAPLMSEARGQLHARAQKMLEAYPGAPFLADAAVDALVRNLAPRLLMMIAKTMVLELNAARLEGSLQGATPQERFVNFTERLRLRNVAWRIFSEYPLMARRVSLCIENWLHSSAEFLERLALDWNELSKLWDPGGRAGFLVEVSAAAGETHRRGRSVLTVRFAGGLQLVYKPRSLAVDEHFQQLLNWANDKGASPPLRLLRVLDRKTHGWVEFVQTAACRSREEVGRFYERQGQYLALLYALQATDFHFENLLACGEHPVLVDFEALFHPWVREIDFNQPDVRMVALAQARSVLRTGLLPRRTGGHGEYAGLELSGLGGSPDQVTDHVLQWAGEQTDEMAAVRRPLRMPGASNRPILEGKIIDAREFAGQILSGFTSMYNLLSGNREELLDENGPLARFAADEVRVVARATRGYGILLFQTFHPDYLRDALDLDRLLDRLWVGVDSNPYLLRLIAAEREDLVQGDVPIFTTTPGSRDVFCSTGRRIDRFVVRSGLELCRETIQGLGPDDCRRQLWFIRASLAILDLQEDELTKSRYQPVPAATRLGASPLSEALIDEARRIGVRLDELSLKEKQHATWIGFAYARKAWSLDALFEDLYTGSSGIILALAYLGSFGFEQYSSLARRALNTLRSRLENRGSQLRSPGAFDGLSGIIYALSHLAVLWDDDELIGYANRLVDRLPELIRQDKALDIIGGSAGCILALLALHRISPSDKALDVAVQCGERLLASATRFENGIGWFNNIETTRPITGFAHGAAGISVSLLELSAVTGKSSYRNAALQAIRYEHGEYSQSAGNWSDNAGEAPSGGPSMAWCYGAPGIGLARIAALQHISDPMIDEDLDRAIAATLHFGLGANHSLCHGDLGNLDFLLQASQVRQADLAGKIDEFRNQILDSIRQYGPLCGVPLRVESPALMNGLAGICYGLLRLAAPERVPCILTLSPPLDCFEKKMRISGMRHASNAAS